MTTTDSLPAPYGSQPIPHLPYWEVVVNVQDSNNNPVPPFAGESLTTFLITASGDAAIFFPAASGDAVMAADGTLGAALLANLKSFFEGLDWDTILTPVSSGWDTPLSLASVQINQYEGLQTDVTPT